MACAVGDIRCRKCGKKLAERWPDGTVEVKVKGLSFRIYRSTGLGVTCQCGKVFDLEHWMQGAD